MMGFSLTTMRYFLPYDLARCPNLLGYLGRIGRREAYRRAMEKGDPGMALLLTSRSAADDPPPIAVACGG